MYLKNQSQKHKGVCLFIPVDSFQEEYNPAEVWTAKPCGCHMTHLQRTSSLPGKCSQPIPELASAVFTPFYRETPKKAVGPRQGAEWESELIQDEFVAFLGMECYFFLELLLPF